MSEEAVPRGPSDGARESYDEPAERSACDWLRALAGGELTAVELNERILERVLAADREVHAVVACDPEEVLAAARAADAARREGDRRPLLGLPVTIKDNLDVAGMRTGAGSAVRPGHRADRDAAAVGRLRAMGAIILAKTNLPEAASDYESENAVFGRTVHPLDGERTPGGSSGGEAALLGSGASIVGIGTDGGGSIRVPSHYCGIVGIRPTVGRVPETGQWPPTRASGMGDLSCVGPMARRVEDLEILLEVIAGPDGIDPFAAPVPLGRASAVTLSSLRVGWYVDPGLPVTASTHAALASATAALAESGATVAELPPPDAAAATELFLGLVGGDGAAHLIEHCGAGPHTRQFQALLDGAAASAPTAAAFFEVQRRAFALRAAVREWGGAADVILCPVVPGPAPLHGHPPGDPPLADGPLAAFNYVHTFAVAGMPAASVPAGEESGLPIGIQVVAAPWREDLVLAAAGQIERRLRA